MSVDEQARDSERRLRDRIAQLERSLAVALDNREPAAPHQDKLVDAVLSVLDEEPSTFDLLIEYSAACSRVDALLAKLRIRLEPCDQLGDNREDASEVYFCPTSRENEQHSGGGFDVCCNRPDLHGSVRGGTPAEIAEYRTEPVPTGSLCERIMRLVTVATKHARSAGALSALQNNMQCAVADSMALEASLQIRQAVTALVTERDEARDEARAELNEALGRLNATLVRAELMRPVVEAARKMRLAWGTYCASPDAVPGEWGDGIDQADTVLHEALDALDVTTDLIGRGDVRDGNGCG